MISIIFCGFGRLGQKTLINLVDNGFDIKYVLTHKELLEDSVDTYCKKMNIRYSYKDSRKNKEETKRKFSDFKPNFLISVNYRFIIPKEIYGLAKHPINIHGSLLPKYRGRSPHVWSIINGETFSGVTCHLMEEKVDTGDIVHQVTVPINKQDTGATLLAKFEVIYPNVALMSIKRLLSGEELIKQNDLEATYYGKRIPEMGYIDFFKEADEVINFVRAQSYPYPGAYSYLINGTKIIIDSIEVCEQNLLELPIGVVRRINGNYYVHCKNSLLLITKYRFDE